MDSQLAVERDSSIPDFELKCVTEFSKEPTDLFEDDSANRILDEDWGIRPDVTDSLSETSQMTRSLYSHLVSREDFEDEETLNEDTYWVKARNVVAEKFPLLDSLLLFLDGLPMSYQLLIFMNAVLAVSLVYYFLLVTCVTPSLKRGNKSCGQSDSVLVLDLPDHSTPLLQTNKQNIEPTENSVNMESHATLYHPPAAGQVAN